MSIASGHRDASVHGFYEVDLDYLLRVHSRIATANPSHSALAKFFTPKVSGFKNRSIHPELIFRTKILIPIVKIRID